MNISAHGLDGVVVADTLLSDVDGERGRLVIAGRDVESLAFTATFEDLAARLWSTSPHDVRRALGAAR
ncbi:MAG: citrate synthase/methylcitrate synthase, partial [Polyangiales bacterium]